MWRKQTIRLYAMRIDKTARKISDGFGTTKIVSSSSLTYMREKKAMVRFYIPPTMVWYHGPSE